MLYTFMLYNIFFLVNHMVYNICYFFCLEVLYNIYLSYIPLFYIML